MKQIMLDKAFGAAGNTIVIEEFLRGKEFEPGEEVSVLTFTDGKTIVPMSPVATTSAPTTATRG